MYVISNKPINYKIMHVVEAFGAGVAHTIHQISRCCSDIPSIVVCGRRDFNEFLARNAVNITIVDWNVDREIALRADARALKQLIEIMRDQKPTIVHCHSSKGGALGRLAAWYLGIPCLYTPHSFSFLRTDVRYASKLIYRAAEYVLSRLGTTVACGLEEYAEATKFGGKLTLVENGIDLRQFRPAVGKGPRNRVTFVAVGRITHQKDFPFFEALATDQRLSTHRFIWITGSDADEGKRSPNLTLIGQRSREQVAEMLRAADCYVSTARWEGLSLASLEAAASGLPLLLRSAPGNRELVFRGLTAEQFETLEQAIESAERVVAAIAADPAYGLENRLLAARFYDVQLMQARIRSIYDAVAFSALYTKSRKG